MKKQNKRKIYINWPLVFSIVTLLLTLGVVATSITACVMYGGKPVTEIPSWALLFMFGGRR